MFFIESSKWVPWIYQTRTGLHISMVFWYCIENPSDTKVLNLVFASSPRVIDNQSPSSLDRASVDRYLDKDLQKIFGGVGVGVGVGRGIHVISENLWTGFLEIFRIDRTWYKVRLGSFWGLGDHHMHSVAFGAALVPNFAGPWWCCLTLLKVNVTLPRCCLFAIWVKKSILAKFG